MSASSTCPKCRYSNPPNARFCANCAARLAVSPSPYQGSQQPPSSPSSSYVWNLVDTARKTSVDRTKLGLLLVIVGILLQPLPYVTYIGLIATLIGVILVIIGRSPFGKTHSNYTILSVVIYFVGFVIGIVAGLLFVFSLVSPTLSAGTQAAIEQTLVSSFNNLLIALLVGGTVIGISYVLFTYALQDSIGRVLLYIAFATQLAVAVSLAYIFGPQVTGAVAQSFSNGIYDPSPMRDLQAQLQLFQALGLIYAVIYSIAYYRAYSQINKGVIPSPISAQPPVTPGSARI